MSQTLHYASQRAAVEALEAWGFREAGGKYPAWRYAHPDGRMATLRPARPGLHCDDAYIDIVTPAEVAGSTLAGR